MRNKLIHTILVFFLFSNASYSHAKYKGDVEVVYQKITLVNDDLCFYLKFQLKNLDVRSNEYLRVEVALENKDNSLRLPPLIFIGKKRYKFDKRSNRLYSDNTMQPYRIYKGTDKHLINLIDYDIQIPYSSWMDHAEIKVKYYFHNCCEEQLVNEKIIAANIIHDKNQKIVSGIDNRQIGVEVPLNHEFYSHDLAPVKTSTPILSPHTENEYQGQVNSCCQTFVAQLNFIQGSSEFRTGIGNNKKELQRIDSLMQMIKLDGRIKIRSVWIVGFASPEGSYYSNEQLAFRRSVNFKKYMQERYRLKDEELTNYWVAEDWNGLLPLLDKSFIACKHDITNIINKVGIFQGRKQKIMQLDNGRAYLELLHGLFPQLRRVELRVDYER